MTVNIASSKTEDKALLDRVQRLALWVIAGFGAYFCFEGFRDYVFEDAYITYRYAKNVASGAGFVFTPGERVFGTTTPLYTLVLALCGWLGGDIPTSSSILFAGSLAAIGLIGGSLLRWAGSPNAALLFALCVVIGAVRVVGYWGLETPFVTALALGAIAAAVRGRDGFAGVLLGLAFLGRYDCALLAILLLAGLWWRRGQLPLRAGLTALAIVTPWLLFAWFYFGSVMPNTLGAKADSVGALEFLEVSVVWQVKSLWGSFSWLETPALRSSGFLGSLNLIFLLGLLAGCVQLWRREPLLMLLIAYPVALAMGYAVIGPPPSFPWYLTPAVYALLLAASLGWGLLIHTNRFASARFTVTMLLVAVGLFGLTHTAPAEAEARYESAHYQGRVGAYREIGDWLKETDLTDLRLILNEPGYMTYRTGNPAIDVAGLVTKGVLFHGDQEQRTDVSGLIESLEPELVLSNLPVRNEGYVLAYSAFPYKQLSVRREEHVARYASLSKAYELASKQPLKGQSDQVADTAPLSHPILLDVRAGDEKLWSQQGGRLERVLPNSIFQYEGEVFEEEVGLVYGYRRGFHTAPFELDFDRLQFFFGGSHTKQTVAQLVVGGRVVLEQSGVGDTNRKELDLLSWPVGPWRGCVAQLRFIDCAAGRSWLAADHIRSVRHSDEGGVVKVLEDFETGEYGDFWVESMGSKPSRLETLSQSFGPQLLTSDYAASSYGLPDKQVLRSRPFLIEESHLSFLLFDFCAQVSAVQIRVQGEVVYSEPSSARGTLRPVTWDLAEHQGKLAVLLLRDQNPSEECWLGIDNLHFFQGPIADELR